MTIHVFYANQHWGTYPNGMTVMDVLDLPDGVYGFFDLGSNNTGWSIREAGNWTKIEETEVPLETRLVKVLMT